MISHVLHGYTFSGKNQKSFNTSKILRPWLRHSPERRSKSFELITGERTFERILPYVVSLSKSKKKGYDKGMV
jgi:hypothetical protein